MALFGLLPSNGEVSFNSLLESLETMKISRYQLKSEKTVENIILQKLREEYNESNFAQQYSISGYFGLKIDIDVDNGDIGIEIKLAKQLENSAANVQRLLGQLIYYKLKQYDDMLIVLIIGNKKQQKEPFMKELIEFIEDDLKLSVVYNITT